MTKQSTDTHMPQCPVAQKCGACQHVSEGYGDQLARKDAFVDKLFAGGVTQGVLRPIIGMDDPYFYRNKVASPFAPGKKLPAAMQTAASQERTRRHSKGSKSDRASRTRHEILCGMYAAGTHRIIATDGCLIENREAKKIILAIRHLMPRFGIEPYREDAGSGFLRHAVVRVGHTSGEILVTLVTNDRQFPASRAFCRELVKKCPGITTIVQNVNERQTNVIFGEREQTLYGPGFILDNLCGLSFRISSQSFYQVNAVQTEVLYNQAVELAGLTGVEHVIDAYCGTGTIGLVAAKRGAASVTGVDAVASSIRDARNNARHNSVENADFVVEDATEFMREAAKRGGHVDVLFMDPPRAGSTPEFLEAAAALTPQRIVYISCNPETQLRDVRTLEKCGYGIEVVQPVDMFPHTEHVETVALLTKRSGRL